jgi:hypothetical protein
MSDLRIVYLDLEGNVCFMMPNLNCGLTIEQIAIKDVPEGCPYMIKSMDDLPPMEDFENWELDFSEPDGNGTLKL